MDIIYAFTLVAVLTIALIIIRLRRLSFQGLVIVLIGTLLGLLLGALISVPLSKLPGRLGAILPIAASAGLVAMMIWVVHSRRHQIVALMPWLHAGSNTAARPAAATAPAEAAPEAPAEVRLPRILVDTSAIIDGRIADIAEAGFIPGRLAVPRFVLAELQNIADSEDAMRRSRGRRGLEVLARLRDLPTIDVDVINDDVTGVREVDAKLVVLAQRFGCNVLTTDYNLNQVAGIQGVRVLNVNELSNAIRPVVIPGEALQVHVVQPGKERNQGVGYLTDGTMIVVENGDKLIGQDVMTEVTRVFQTVAGKMIFAAPKNPGHAPAKDQVPQKNLSRTVNPAEEALIQAVENPSEPAPAKRHRNSRNSRSRA